MRVSKKVKRAMEKAKKEVIKNAEKPKKKKKKVIKKVDTEARSPSGKWIKDEWGNQGEVFFDGYRYWGVFLEPSNTPGVMNAVSRYWSPEKWEERKKPQKEVEPKPTITETEKPLLSTPKITKSTKTSKRVPKKKSPKKSGKTATHATQRKWEFNSTSLERKERQ